MYEEQRDNAPAAWLRQAGLQERDKPRIVQIAPTITGVWENYKYSVANSDIFFLDTRSQRDLHDTKQPGKPGISMIGKKQREWLMDEMKKSKADFFFIVSTVTMMIPHVGSGGYAKHENGYTGELKYAEAIAGRRERKQ